MLQQQSAQVSAQEEARRRGRRQEVVLRWVVLEATVTSQVEIEAGKKGNSDSCEKKDDILEVPKSHQCLRPSTLVASRPHRESWKLLTPCQHSQPVTHSQGHPCKAFPPAMTPSRLPPACSQYCGKPLSHRPLLLPPHPATYWDESGAPGHLTFFPVTSHSNC